MTPAAAKLLMCVCAGSTGAALVPVSKRVHAAIKPRPAIHRTAAPVEAAARPGVPCLPYEDAVTAAGLGTAAPFSLDNLPPAATATAAATPTGYTGFTSSDHEAIGGGGALPGTTPTPAIPTIPITNAVPEPASWAMMISGVGIVGGAMRWRRLETASA